MTPARRRAFWGAAGIAAVGAALGAAATRPRHTPPVATGTTSPREGALVLHVPRARGAVIVDGEPDDPGWRDPVGRTGAFVGEDGAPTRPYSDVRAVWDDGHLYLVLYAADEDIEATHDGGIDDLVWQDDSFHLAFARGDHTYALDVSPLGAVCDADRIGDGPPRFGWQSHAVVGVDMDGTLGDPTDDDEEWLVEMAIPLGSLGLSGRHGEAIAFSVRRCDTPRGRARVCGRWGDEASFLVLE